LAHGAPGRSGAFERLFIWEFYMSRFWKIALAVIVVVLIAGFFLIRSHQAKGGDAAAGAQANGEGQGKDQPPVPVTVVPVATQDVPVYLTALGTVQARNTVTVRPQVGGQLMKLNFQEGQEVKKGDVIAEIDPRTIQSQYDQSVAKLKQDSAIDYVVTLGAPYALTASARLSPADWSWRTTHR
jgi:multidrug efflux system membrane fusion protein